MGRGQCRGGKVGRDLDRDPAAPAVEDDREGAPQESAIPHQAASRQQRPRILGQGHVPELGAEDAADDSRDDHVGAVFLVPLAPPEFEGDEPAADDEPQHHGDAEAGDLERADSKDERVDRSHEEVGER